MTVYQNINQILTAHGVTKEYSQEEIDAFIREAKLLIDTPYINETKITEYDKYFEGDTYLTKEYPVLTDTVELTLNDKNITPDHVTHDGVIYLQKNYSGKLKCSYTCGLDGDEIQNYLLPIVACLIEDKEGLNVSSISEGDVSISYNNVNTNTARSLDTLVAQLKERYSSKVQLI